MFQPSDELRQLQLHCLEILKIVHKICVDNDIQYSLCGGSVVGAYLYGGFIPWDDDVDIMMTRENYDKFIKVCKKELPSGYIIQNYNTDTEYYTLFSKIIDTNTTLIQEYNGNKSIISGIFLDITVYDKVPNNKIFWNIDLFFMKLCMWVFFSNESNRGLRRAFYKLFGNKQKWLFNLAQNIFKLNSKCENYSYCELFGAFCNNKKYDKELFENYTYIDFENEKFMVLRDYVKYLECRYERTDFYEPEEKQVPTHYVKVDFNKSYLSEK